MVQSNLFKLSSNIRFAVNSFIFTCTHVFLRSIEADVLVGSSHFYREGETKQFNWFLFILLLSFIVLLLLFNFIEKRQNYFGSYSATLSQNAEKFWLPWINVITRRNNQRSEVRRTLLWLFFSMYNYKNTDCFLSETEFELLID